MSDGMPNPVVPTRGPGAPACELCERTRQFCRGLCRSCYRKLRAQGIDMRPPRRRGRAAGTLLDLVVRVVARLTSAERARVRVACEATAEAAGESGEDEQPAARAA
jgi:hypothetical protein